MSAVGTSAPTRPGEGTARSVLRRVGRVLVDDRFFGVVLVLLWVAWLALTAVAQTRVVPVDRLAADVSAGRVVAWDVLRLDATLRDDGHGWAEHVEDALVADDGPADPDATADQEVLAYRVDGWFAAVRVVDPSGPVDGVREGTATLRAAGVGSVAEDGPWQHSVLRVESRAAWAAVPLVLLFLGSVAAGPQPTRGTRWFWIWLVFVTLGLGVLAYAVVEQLRPAPRPGTPGARRRWTGVGGFLLMVLLGPLVAAVLAHVVDTTGWIWPVRPG